MDEPKARIELSRRQVLAFRRRAAHLGERLSPGARSRREAARAGLQDSMPRAALVSIHARVEATGPDSWRAAPLVQVWGPRYSAFVVARDDVALFTLGRLPEEARARRRAEDVAARLEAALGAERMDCRDAARLVGLHPNALRYAAPTGRFLIHWDGAHQPLIWREPAPDLDPMAARMELARRFFHFFGPTTVGSFASWAGLRPPAAMAAFQSLHGELIPVRTPIGDAWALGSDESDLESGGEAVATRLLPSGDTYFLLQGRDRELLVPDASRRALLWTSRVWPGAVLHEGEIVGTWRRSGHRVTVQPWQRLSRGARDDIHAEAESLPLAGLNGAMEIGWAL